MPGKTQIEWTEKVWNPVTGCTKVSPGCRHCYAERITRRFKDKFPNGFAVTLRPDRLDQPLHWRKPSVIFVNSMSDLFHEDVPLEFIRRVFDVARSTDRHVFQILTKRHQRLAELAPELEPWPSNIWMGVSVETADYLERIDYLRRVPAAVRFVSFEPLLGPILQINLTDIHWVIVGGESGPKHRPMHHDWVVTLRDQAITQRVPFFFKQWGGRTPKRNGRLLDGQIWNAMPVAFARWKQSFVHT